MHTTPTHRILSVPASLLRSFRRERDRREAAHALRHLGDHILKDIGLHPGDIDAAVRGRHIR